MSRSTGGYGIRDAWTGNGRTPERWRDTNARIEGPVVFAGLWDSWKKPDGQTLQSYTIVTTEANEMLAPVHNRMPVMLSDSDVLDWLKGNEIEHALSLLKPFPAELMDSYEVSKLVNSPSNDRPACIAPV